MLRSFLLLLGLHLIGVTIPLTSLQAEAWGSTLDLRDLPAMTRPSAAIVEVDTIAAAEQRLRPLITFAINGRVIQRVEADPAGKTVLRVPLRDRLISTQNEIEVAAILPNCSTDTCKIALASARQMRPVRFELSKPQVEIDDFSQLVTTYRAGIAFDAETPRERQLLAVVRGALAPRGRFDADAKAFIHIGSNPPKGTVPLLRFDRGAMQLERSDNKEIFTFEQLQAMTIVQLVRGRDRPMLWIRPGTGPLPDDMYLSDGDIALFDSEGRAIAWSTSRDDRSIRVTYINGHDPYGGDQMLLYWRVGLAIFWLLASLGLLWVYRRIPAPSRSEVVK